MSCHTQFQPGLVLLPAVPRLLEHPVLPALSPAQGPWLHGQSPEADEGFGSSAKPKANSGALTPSKPRGLLSAGCAAPKAPGAPGMEDGAGAALPRGSLLQVERLDAEIPVPGAALEQAGVANAECGHTVSPSKRCSRCFSAWCSNLGKMKPSIMHLSPQCLSQPGADQR